MPLLGASTLSLNNSDMTTRSLHLLLISAAATFFVACSTDDEQEPSSARYPLTIEVQENPLVNPDANARATRAAITSTSSLTTFTLDYQYGAAPNTGSMKATKGSNGQWTSGTWPYSAVEGNLAVSWYAHTDGTFYAGADPYVSFSVEKYASSQKDLLVATATSTYSETDGKLSFTFDHATTALRFYVKKATNLADYTLSITSVRLCNIINKGQYDYATSSWTPGNSRSYYTLYEGSAKTLGTADYEALDASDAPYLFMIPQTLTAWDGTTAITSATTQGYIQIACTISKDANNVYSGTAYIPFGATLSAGMQHDVKINIGKNSLYSDANAKIIQ